MRRVFSFSLLHLCRQRSWHQLGVAVRLPGSACRSTLPGTNTRSPLAFLPTNTPIPPRHRHRRSRPPHRPTLTPSLTPTFTDSPSLTPSPTYTPSPTRPWSDRRSLPGRLQSADRAALSQRRSDEPAQPARSKFPTIRRLCARRAASIRRMWSTNTKSKAASPASPRSSAATRPTHVGPVRSGRLMDLNLVPMYEALFSYSGASAPIQQLFLQPALAAVDHLARRLATTAKKPGFCRFPKDGVAFEHTLYADTNQDLGAGDGARRQRRTSGARLRLQRRAGRRTASPRPTWTCTITGRSMPTGSIAPTPGITSATPISMPHMDAADGQQLWADNVVVIEVPHEERPDLFEEESKSASQQIDLWGQGRAYVFRDGQYYEGYWRRDCRGEVPDPTPTPVVGDAGDPVLRPHRRRAATDLRRQRADPSQAGAHLGDGHALDELRHDLQRPARTSTRPRPCSP